MVTTFPSSPADPSPAGSSSTAPGTTPTTAPTTGTPLLLGDPYKADCPTRRILDRIGDRWTVLVVGVLSEGDARFSQLARRVEGVSQKMLTQTLRGLERDGLVRRTVHAEVPVRVEYALTEAGRTLCEPLLALQRWAVTHLEDVSASQRAHDEVA